MFYFLFIIIWYFTILPLCFLIVYPFYRINIIEYTKHITKDVLKIKHVITKDAEYINSGFILANHRCWTDFFLDPVISNSAIVARRMAILAFLFMCTLHHLQTGIILINKNKDTRQQIYKKIKEKMIYSFDSKFKRIVFWPEGSRLRYTTLNSPEDVKKYLKYGLLKEIYYDNIFPVQLQISSNKEFVIDEKNMVINKNIFVKTHISLPIYPKDYPTEHEFYNTIAKEWYNAWIKVN